jgi:hypothetical protein
VRVGRHRGHRQKSLGSGGPQDDEAIEPVDPHIGREWALMREGGRAIAAQVAAFVGVGCPLILGWARGISTVLGNQLAKFECSVFTDCDGIGAPLEALRIMRLSGVLGNFEHVAGSEINPGARAFLWQHHPPPRVMFKDITARNWQSGGADIDLITGEPRRVPVDVDVYVCGFPCTPFSTRRTNETQLFDEEQAIIVGYTQLLVKGGIRMGRRRAHRHAIHNSD